MLRPSILLLLAALAATPTAPSGAVPASCAGALVVGGAPVSWPDSHRLVDGGRAVDAAEADATGAGAGSSAPLAVHLSVPARAGAAAYDPSEPGPCPLSFHLRERPSHPANAPPRSA